MFRQRFFWKLFLSFVVTILAASLAFGSILYRHLYNTALSTLKANLKKETEMLGEILQNSAEPIQDSRRLAHVVHIDDRITIISPDGTVLADNWAEKLGKHEIENHSDRPEFKAALTGRPIFVQRFSHTVQREMMYYGIPVRRNGSLLYVLRLSFPLTTFLDQMAEVRDFLLFAALSSILLSLPLAYFLSRGIQRPIENLRMGTHRAAQGDLTHRIRVEGPQEFQELATDFNWMAEQLREKISNIQKEHNRTETLLSKMVEGVLAVDWNGKAVFANTAFCRMVGLGIDRIHGRSFLEITRNDQLSEYISILLQEGSVSSPEAREIQLFGPDGERDYFVQASRIQEDGGGVGLVLLVFHDITRTKRIEQIRRDFVANVSHELRTPLTALKGSTEVLLDGAYEKPEESRRFLEIMDKQLRNIQNLVSDMLKLAAVEDTRAPIRREIVEIKSFISDIISLIRPLAQKKRQHLKVVLPEETVQLNIDSGQISDALMNLLDNAIKYTDDGGTIELLIQTHKEGLEVQVKDNGSGIPQEQLGRIFERFYRVDKSRSREMGGTGLGLSIAKHAVENHGGSISVQSEPGRGSTFTIRLPGTSLQPVS